MILLLRLVLNVAALLIVAKFVPGFDFSSIYSALIAALILGLVNGLVRPIVLLLTLPITILSLGLFTFVVNALMLWLTHSIVKGFMIDTFSTAITAAIILWLISLVTNLLEDFIHSRRVGRHG